MWEERIEYSPQSGDKSESSCEQPSDVNHPSHYNSHPSGVECIEVAEHMSFCIGSAIKYLWRAGLKPGNNRIQDLEKAVWYIRREIDRLFKMGEIDDNNNS
jgi:hypothetical protein